MLHYKYEHDFDIDVKSYWELFFSEDYNVDLYKELKMKDRKLIEQKEEGNILRRTVKLIPGTDIPALFRSVISDMSYTEHDVFDRAKSSMTVRIEPSLMKDRFQMGGVYSVQPLGDHRCRRTYEGDAKVSIMLLGGKIEKYMVDEIKTSYDIAARVTRKWIEMRKAAAKPAT